MELRICTRHKGIDYVLIITDYRYYKGCPSTGPTYSCGGTPPEPEELEINDGYAQIDTNPSKTVNEINLQLLESSKLFNAIIDCDEEQIMEKAIQEHHNLQERIECNNTYSGKWGYGVNLKDDGRVLDYGAPISNNPNQFSPDLEVCTLEELHTWEKAKNDYNRENK